MPELYHGDRTDVRSDARAATRPRSSSFFDTYFSRLLSLRPGAPRQRCGRRRRGGPGDALQSRREAGQLSRRGGALHLALHLLPPRDQRALPPPPADGVRDAARSRTRRRFGPRSNRLRRRRRRRPREAAPPQGAGAARSSDARQSSRSGTAMPSSGSTSRSCPSSDIAARLNVGPEGGRIVADTRQAGIPRWVRGGLRRRRGMGAMTDHYKPGFRRPPDSDPPPSKPAVIRLGRCCAWPGRARRFRRTGCAAGEGRGTTPSGADRQRARSPEVDRSAGRLAQSPLRRCCWSVCVWRCAKTRAQGPARALAPAQPLATIEALSGAARLMSSSERAGRTGVVAGRATAFERETAWTRPGGGLAALRLASGASVRIDRGTRLRLMSETTMMLGRGDHLRRFRQRAAGDRPLEVRTPLGVARDIGTRFEVRFDGSALRVRVRDGLVRLTQSRQSHDAKSGGRADARWKGPRRAAPRARCMGQSWAWADALANPFESGGAIVCVSSWTGSLERMAGSSDLRTPPSNGSRRRRSCTGPSRV